MWTLTQINAFEDIIDVRSPAEYHHDHVPGALNLPVLNDAQRTEIGTIYKRVSSLEARRRGAALVADNISRHLQAHFSNRPPSWRPLVYCWRGGMRSAALTHVLQEIGWHAEQLPGGYKMYRKTVIQALENTAPRLNFKVLCGCTGTGKSRLLARLAELGAQIVDLEALANHRGSVLGAPLTSKQPSQKYFENLLCRELDDLNPELPVFIEAESRRIGKIQVPSTLLDTMHNAECVRVNADLDARIGFLADEYRHFIKDDALLKDALRPLIRHLGKNKVEQWMNWRRYGTVRELIGGLLNEHYDPFYLRSMRKHFRHYDEAHEIRLEAVNDTSLRGAARQLIR